MGYSFTSPEVAGALVRAKQRGLDVKVVLDWKANTGRQNKASLAAMNLLVNAGIPVRTVSQYKIMHDKGHCCKVSDEAAFCLIQRPYISKTLLTRRISPRGSP